MIKFGLLVFWLVPVFSSVILGILRFSSSHSMFMNIRARLGRPFLTLLCLITTGHLGRIFLLSSYGSLCDYLWSIFIWLVPVFSSVILGILRFSSSHSILMNIRARLRGPFPTLLCLTTTGHLGWIFLLSSYGYQFVSSWRFCWPSGSRMVEAAPCNICTLHYLYAKNFQYD